METFNNNNRQNRRLGVGIFLLILGSIFMMKNFGLIIPFWVTNWHTILLALGLWFGYKKNFKAGGWVVMVLIGAIFTMKDIVFFDMAAYTKPLVLIGVGLYLILKPKKELHFCDFGHRKPNVDFGDAMPK